MAWGLPRLGKESRTPAQHWQGLCSGPSPGVSQPEVASRGRLREVLAGRGAAHLKASSTEGAVTMTALQELANAATMLPQIPTTLSVLLSPGLASGAHVVALAVLLHNPFSVLYHLHSAAHVHQPWPMERDPFLKLDLCFIHGAGALMSPG